MFSNLRSWRGRFQGSSAFSTRPRCSRSPTARSPPRSTSPSGSSPCTRWASRPRCSPSSAPLFLVVSLSYAEGTTAIPETGGAATFVRRAFNDLAGFLTGWALFLDYLIVIALSALFMPHYLGAALKWQSLEHNPWDVVVGVGVIMAVAAIRLVRRSAFYRYGIFVAVLDLSTQLMLVVLGFAFLFSGEALTHGISIGSHPSWHQIVFALPLAMLAYTGLETVANLAEEAREPGRDLPRSLFSGIGLVVVIYVAIALVALSAFPAQGGTTSLGTDWLNAPLMGIVDALRGPLARGPGDRVARVRRPHGRGDPPRRGHDLDLRVHPACPLARRARAVAARLRPPQPADARIAAGHRRRSAHLGRASDRDLLHQGRHRLPGEPVQLRRPGRVHRRPARGDQAALQRARAPTALPGAGKRAHPGRRGASSGAGGLGRDLLDLGRGSGHACGRPLRRPGLARGRAGGLRARSQRTRRGPACSMSRRRRSTCPKRSSRASSSR